MRKIFLNILLFLFTACEIGDINDVKDENEETVDSSSIFYVSHLGSNDNDGSLEKPWKTIQFAIDSIHEKATIVIKSGIYNERVFFVGDEDSNIYLKGEKGSIIDGSGLNPVNRQALIEIQNAHHIIVENLELRNFKTKLKYEAIDTPVGILIEGRSHDINITKNRVHHIENLSTCGESSGCASGANGISVYGNKSTTISNLNFIGNEVYNCVLSSSEAFTINGNVDGFKIIDNYIHDNNNIGLDIVGYEKDVCPECSEEENRARNGIVKGNRLVNNSVKLPLGTFNKNPWYEGEGGSAGGFYVDGGHHILFEGNYASQNDLGFEFASEHAGKSSSDILMVNNYIYNNREAGLSLGGYSSDSRKEGGGNAQNIMVYNNSFYKNAGWGSEISFAFRVYDTTLANNIVYGEGEVSENFVKENFGAYRNITWGKNIWWAEDVADTSGLEGEALVKNPLYLDASKGNLDLNSSSPAVNEAIDQSAITSWSGSFWENEFADGLIPASGTKDIHGQQRIHEQLDIGADEV